MASRTEIFCVNKSDGTNLHERITHIGGSNADNSKWRITQQKAIAEIENGQWQFFVHKEADTVNVIVATSRNGNKYIKTEADGEQPDNLLSLPECILK